MKLLTDVGWFKYLLLTEKEDFIFLERKEEENERNWGSFLRKCGWNKKKCIIEKILYKVWIFVAYMDNIRFLIVRYKVKIGKYVPYKSNKKGIYHIFLYYPIFLKVRKIKKK